MNRISNSFFAYMLNGTVLLALLVGVPEAEGQALFGVQYDEDTIQRMIEAEKPITSKALGKTLGREGRLVYKGNRPTRARFVISFAGGNGKRHRPAVSEPFKLEPGRHATSERFPDETWLVLFKRAFPGDQWYPGDQWFPLDTYAPDDARWDEKRGIINGIYDRLNRNQVGIVLALVPANERERGEAQIRPLELVLRPADR